MPGMRVACVPRWHLESSERGPAYALPPPKLIHHHNPVELAGFVDASLLLSVVHRNVQSRPGAVRRRLV